MLEMLLAMAVGIFGPFIVAGLIAYPLWAPMPKWRQRQLERKKPMKERVIDIDVEIIE